MGHVILVTGAARQLGAAVVRGLLGRPEVARVIGTDTAEPVDPPDGGHRTAAPFVRAAAGDPAIAHVLAEERVDTVVHAGLVATPGQAGGRAAMKDINVIGTMQLLAACQRSASVRRFVLASATAAYGSSPRSAGVLHEDDPARSGSLGPFGKDIGEAEGYLRGFGRRRPDVTVVVVRLADLIGGGFDTPMGAYLSLPALPTVLGYDPRLQFLHPADAVEVLCRAALDGPPGTFNAAGGGVLLLSQIARRFGRPTVRVARPVLATTAGMLRRMGAVDLTADQLNLLTFGRVVDSGRLSRTFGYVPRWTTAAAVAEFARTQGIHGPLAADRLEAVERTVAGLIRGFGLGPLGRGLPDRNAAGGVSAAPL